MGTNFDFKNWCDQWLKSSGVNILEATAEYNADESIKSLQIKQFAPQNTQGLNRLRK